MTSIEETINKLLLLPEDVQRQALDYIDSLYSKYALPVDQLEESVDDEEIPQELKDLLNERLAAHERNPENAKPWDEVKQKFEFKYGYK